MAHKRSEHDASSISLTPNTHTTIPTLPQVVALPSLLDQALAEPDWLIPGLLPTGVSLLAGPSLVDKPLLANQLGLSVATGTPFLGHLPARQGSVLYLALVESLLHVRGRVVNLLPDRQYPDTFHLAFQWSPFRAGGLADLEDTIAELDTPRLVIVDPLEFVLPLRNEAHQGGNYRVRQNAIAESTLTFFLPLRELAARYNLAILLLHHLPDDWPTNRRDPLAGLSPTGLTPASACNLLLTPTRDPWSCTLHLAGPTVAERRLHLTYEHENGQWVCKKEE